MYHLKTHSQREIRWKLHSPDIVGPFTKVVFCCCCFSCRETTLPHLSPKSSRAHFGSTCITRRHLCPISEVSIGVPEHQYATVWRLCIACYQHRRLKKNIRWTLFLCRHKSVTSFSFDFSRVHVRLFFLVCFAPSSLSLSPSLCLFLSH